MIEKESPLPVETKPHEHYMLPLDGLRGLACLLVVFIHISRILELNYKDDLYNVGGFGVVIFFALSGFLMSTLYCEKSFSFDACIKYLIARMSRIAPAYWIAVICAWALYMLIPGDFEYQMTPLNMLRSFVFMGNVGVFWSIPPEIQFYLFFPLLWFSYEKMKQNYIWCALTMALMCGFFIATKDLWGGLILASKLHIFVFGFLAAFLARSEDINRYLCNRVSQIALIVTTLLYAIFILEYAKIYEDILMAALIAVTVASLSRSTSVTTLLETRTMRLMGAASFSVYLFHDMILHAMKDLGFLNYMSGLGNIAVMCLISLALPIAFHFMAEKRLNIVAREKGMLAFAYFKTRWPLNRFSEAR